MGKAWSPPACRSAVNYPTIEQGFIGRMGSSWELASHDCDGEA